MNNIVGEKTAAVFMYLLAICAFPSACFSSLIAANSFKATLPSVKPLYSCGLGAIVAIILAVTGWVGNAVGVFSIIGASFGPVCGAMLADYLLSGCKWAGPRAGLNPAGWISWVVGFAVSGADFIPGLEPDRSPARLWRPSSSASSCTRSWPRWVSRARSSRCPQPRSKRPRVVLAMCATADNPWPA